MAVDMKQSIAEAVAVLIFEKHKKKITVKDVVEECNITRQAFYYHFADIPDLMRWMVEQKAYEIRSSAEQMPDGEERLKYLFLLFLNGRKGVQRSLESNYGKELEQILFDQMMQMCHDAAMEREEICAMNEADREFVIRYHCYAGIGYLLRWEDKDTDQLDHIVHNIWLIINGQSDQLFCSSGRKK